jgi:hypothetical protein
MRGEASTSSYAPSFDSSGNIGACTRALASPRLLPTQILRRGHLLRARAATHLRSGDIPNALADIDLAEAATVTLANDPFYQRSMGLSLQLLRAIAFARSDKAADAAQLAQSAAAARPYSLQVQTVAAGIVQATRPLGAPSPSPWIEAQRLSPDAAVTAISKEAEVGNFVGVVALRPGVQVDWPAAPLPAMALAARTPDAAHLLSAVFVSLHTAYARAATNDAEGARRDLAEVRAQLAATRPVAADGKITDFLVSTNDALDQYVDMRARQIEARIAITEARPSDAIGALLAAPMPNDAATIELLTALRAAVPVTDAGLVPSTATFEKQLGASRLKALADLVSNALIAPETPRAVVDYERARPDILGALVGGAFSLGTSLLGGIRRTDGFRTTTQDDGSIRVEFIGNTPSSSLVQEMTLLRAAEVAREAGKSAFAVVDRKDFSRRMNTMRGGMMVSSVPSGFKTELTIRLADAVTDAERSLDALAVIDGLGPLYYEQNDAKR